MAKKSKAPKFHYFLLISFSFKEVSTINSFQIEAHTHSASVSRSRSHPTSPVYSAPLSPCSFQSQQLREQQLRPSLLSTVLNLTGCVMGVAGSICYEVTSYWTKVQINIIYQNLIISFSSLDGCIIFIHK